jgi:hypothetical protein
VAGRQDGLIFASVALSWADVADAAVTMIDVVPTHELSRPSPGLLQAGNDQRPTAPLTIVVANSSG